jgi:hypothetical protein
MNHRDIKTDLQTESPEAVTSIFPRKCILTSENAMCMHTKQLCYKHAQCMRNITVAKSPYCLQQSTYTASVTASSVCKHRTELEEHNTSAPLLQYYSKDTLYCIHCDRLNEHLPEMAFSA